MGAQVLGTVRTQSREVRLKREHRVDRLDDVLDLTLLLFHRGRDGGLLGEDEKPGGGRGNDGAD